MATTTTVAYGFALFFRFGFQPDECNEDDEPIKNNPKALNHSTYVSRGKS